MFRRREFIKRSLMAAGVCGAHPLIAAPGQMTFAKSGRRPARRAKPFGSSDPNVILMQKLFSKLAATIGVDSQSSPYPGGTFLTLANPGIIINPAVDLTQPHDRRILSHIVDRIPYPNISQTYQPSDVVVADVYNNMLGHHCTADWQLTPQEQKDLNAANKELKDHEADYKKYRRIYAQALDNYDAAEADYINHGTPVPNTVIADLDDARMDFEDSQKGRRFEVEHARDVKQQLQGGDPAVYWQGLRQAFGPGEQDGANRFWFVDLAAQPKDWSTQSWTRMTFNEDDYDHQSYSHQLSVGGGFGADFGLWRASVNASYTENQGWDHFKSTGYALDFEIANIELDRTWLDALVFRMHNWQFEKGYGYLLSDGGDPRQGVTPQGAMTIYAVSLLVARNVSLSASLVQQDSDYFDKAIDGSTSVGWGPFSFSGHYHEETHEKHEKGQRAGNTLTFVGPQVIGWICDVLPRSPDPDPALTWPAMCGLTLESAFPGLELGKARTLKEREAAWSRLRGLIGKK
jgi:hypothetical protein